MLRSSPFVNTSIDTSICDTNLWEAASASPCCDPRACVSAAVDHPHATQNDLNRGLQISSWQRASCRSDGAKHLSLAPVTVMILIIIIILLLLLLHDLALLSLLILLLCTVVGVYYISSLSSVIQRVVRNSVSVTSDCHFIYVLVAGSGPWPRLSDPVLPKYSYAL